ncbi:hypothetical protein LY44_03525 [Rhodobacter capsulatus]|uniref:Uncharacterized protein n=1 Tax=Rhodobacter capsulatus TaxID=1061 RepID=A0A1G7IWB5_RHOCA|nr:hypothetical protein LY44_03525 [Rhodobacter capsulatus]SDF16905.1 hypothetical protein SAMN04244550_01810 [Rhodobacter capsulatus]
MLASGFPVRTLFFLKRYEDGLAACEVLTELLLSVFCREEQALLW